jgi:hypothetical protein
VNAAYLVLTTAWLAGDAPAAPAPPPAAPVVSAPIGGGCGGGCGSATDACCEDQCGGKQGLFGRLKAKFKKGNACGCEAAPTCCAPVQQHCCPAPAPTCCAPVQHHSDCCEDPCKKPGLFAKLKGKFKKGNDCCESSYGGGCGTSCGCNGGGIGGVYSAPATGAPAESIPSAPKPGEAPRKMPTPGTGSVMHGYPTIVTPVVAPRLTSEQPF